MNASIKEFLLITTVGPSHLRLCEDLRRYIVEVVEFLEAMQWQSICCCECAKTLIIMRKGGDWEQVNSYYEMHEALFCYDCSPWAWHRNQFVSMVK